MKWILSTLVIPVVLSAKPFFPVTHNEQMTAECCYDELEGERDLFKRYDQVYTGGVEFLYWTIAEGGLDYALKMKHDAWGPSPSFAQGSFKHGSFHADPGFRLSLIYFRAPHHWDAKWSYTRMTNRGHDHAHKPDAPNQFLTGTFPQISTNPLASAHSTTHFNYNVFDWLVHRVFFPNPHLKLRFGGGGFLTWMSQDWKVRYIDSLANVTTIRNRWNFVGAGLKTGATFDWYWTWDLYMTAQGFFGLAMGTYSNRASESTSFQPLAGDDTNVPVRQAHYKDGRAALTAQLMFGPSYQKNFCSTRLEIFAGFEMNTWFNLQEVYRSTQNAAELAKETWINTGLLTLYGLTTRASLDY